MNCGVCLQEALESPLKIFDVDGEQQNIAHILRQHFLFLEFAQNDNSTSPIICRYCWLKINNFHKFYVTVEQAHLKLTTTSRASVKGECKTEIPVDLDVQVIIKQESLENWPEQILITEREAGQVNASDDDVSNPLYDTDVLGCLETELDGNSEILKDVETYPNESRDHKTQKRKLKTTSCTVTNRSSKKAARQDAESEDNSTEDKDKKSSISKLQKRQQASPHDDAIVRKHIPMGCDLCAFVGEDFIAMSTHFRLQHKNVKPYVMCCNKKLSKRFLVVQHAYKHENPEYFKCEDCQKVFSDGSVLRSHMLANHAPEEELKFSCDQCPKKFSRRYILELHKPSHIPINERKFLCEKCPQPKTFASEHLLQIHINMRHTRATNVCHVCAKEIRDKQAFEKHVRLHFEDSGPRVKCPRPNCDSWLKDADNLKEHLRRHNDEGKIFPCDDCGKICKNRRSLRSHINYTHKSTEFTCGDCNKTFKKAISLKEHMAQHTGETLYKCPFCYKTFNSNANMHSHKKKAHPVEWEIWRKTKRGSSQQQLSDDFIAEAASNNLSNDNVKIY